MVNAGMTNPLSFVHDGTHSMAALARYAGAMQTGEVGIEIAPILAAPSLEPTFAAQLDVLLRRTCQIARALTGAEQAALKLRLGEDPSQARKYFSLSEKYAAFRDFRVDPKGNGLHGMTIPPGEVVRLTEAEVLSHPLFQGFGPFADAHPPMRGWLATSVWGGDGRIYGLLQLSDKSGGRDFDESDETNIHELAALIGETLDALRLAARRPAK
jgi:GAF domain-containing protein